MPCLKNPCLHQNVQRFVGCFHDLPLGKSRKSPLPRRRVRLWANAAIHQGALRAFSPHQRFFRKDVACLIDHRNRVHHFPLLPLTLQCVMVSCIPPAPGSRSTSREWFRGTATVIAATTVARPLPPTAPTALATVASATISFPGRRLRRRLRSRRLLPPDPVPALLLRQEGGGRSAST